ncbi:KAP family P-loop NTPase fold protein [Novosphingobium guangzhouense]|uniref:KAP NTPase domain-containing protein n=1 Tax=Novosphingobium guangzhouense TaxID=1850347 RepID=A0A2K2G623_9SPHN|nr:P-loop NTPase fold protein [Novosphingobium guangzhouense]PNU06486.1 hypothetical protein A8V01_02785 [Novosphingobium guangzhouense]
MEQNTVLEDDDVWKGDLFSRREEALLLQAYIESVSERPSSREDKRAFTIAVDAGYGEGKSFFLRRFADHMSQNHPVAFVDAWADDLADQPLTALAATLNTALKPFMTEPLIQGKMATFLRKSGQVAKIAGIGLLRRGLGLVITGGAVDGIDSVLASTDLAVKEVIEDGMADVGQGLVDDTANGITSVGANDLMQTRIDEFEAGRAAIQSMKDSLSGLIDALEHTTSHPPIIIIIDELDRCRPTYAVKLLEEIKHLFDVSGIVFILGINTQQLSHSVAGAYGSKFDGISYLKRFIDRQYKLAKPEFDKLVRQQCLQAGIGSAQIAFPQIMNFKSHLQAKDLAEIISWYMQIYQLTARDSFQLIDILQTSVSLSEGKQLHGALLVPLAIGHMKGKPAGEIPDRPTDHTIGYRNRINNNGKIQTEDISIHRLAEDFIYSSKISKSEFYKSYSENNASVGIIAASTAIDWDNEKPPLNDMTRYHDLIEAVGRFRNPKVGESAWPVEEPRYLS